MPNFKTGKINNQISEMSFNPDYQETILPFFNYPYCESCKKEFISHDL